MSVQSTGSAQYHYPDPQGQPAPGDKRAREENSDSEDSAQRIHYQTNEFDNIGIG